MAQEIFHEKCEGFLTVSRTQRQGFRRWIADKDEKMVHSEEQRMTYGQR